ncbi:Ankyrin Repeat Domain-Containing Protein 20B [Manis pentadactyla]|nr:Ankyrin Repeat Domain-Containing Protein 20B [Manis pentadactyla]
MHLEGGGRSRDGGGEGAGLRGVEQPALRAGPPAGSSQEARAEAGLPVRAQSQLKPVPDSEFRGLKNEVLRLLDGCPLFRHRKLTPSQAV